MTWYLAVLATLLGLVVGSFLNVVIYRLPRKESLARPGSHCPGCNHPVRWRDNLPLVSWLLLRGHCRDCGAPISKRYPLVEAITGGLYLAAFLVYGISPYTILAWAFLAALVAITFIDLDHLIIPDKIVLPGAAIGYVASVLLNPTDWWVHLVSALGAAAFLFVIGLIWGGGVGFGDVKMTLMMGAVLGAAVVVALFVGFLVGAVVGVVLMASGIKKRKDKMPFGPYLALGGAVAALAGPEILDWYMSLL
jgi:leader peptidase (prepilin peptidase)/N-methyltransferase